MGLRNRIDLVLGRLLAAIMALMVINVLWQVITRFAGNPSSFTDELARYLMIWLGILGAAYVSGKKMHVAIDLISSRLQPVSRNRVSIMINVLIASFALFCLVIGGSRLVYITYILGQNSPALQIPLAAVYFIIPVSGLVIMYYKISDLFLKS